MFCHSNRFVFSFKYFLKNCLFSNTICISRDTTWCPDPKDRNLYVIPTVYAYVDVRTIGICQRNNISSTFRKYILDTAQ